MLRIIFMGTPDFAIPALDAIVNSGSSILAIVTQPDKPKGRGKQLAKPPVKVWGEDRGVIVLQPKSAKSHEFIDRIRGMNPDLIITAAYGQILSKELLDIPRLGCINIHASLLPKYRGASPIQQALIDGEEKTGVTIMYMDVGMDTGDVILMKETVIDPGENAGELHDRLAMLGGDLAKKAIELFREGRPEGTPQDDSLATYCSKIDKSMGEIDWNKPASFILNLVRGLTPWPGVYTYLHGQRLKVWKVEKWEYFTLESSSPGSVIISGTKEGLVIRCRESALRIVTLQVQGSKPMPSCEYLKGNSIDLGTILGDKGAK